MTSITFQLLKSDAELFREMFGSDQLDLLVRVATSNTSTALEEVPFELRLPLFLVLHDAIEKELERRGMPKFVIESEPVSA